MPTQKRKHNIWARITWLCSCPLHCLCGVCKTSVLPCLLFIPSEQSNSEISCLHYNSTHAKSCAKRQTQSKFGNVLYCAVIKSKAEKEKVLYDFLSLLSFPSVTTYQASAATPQLISGNGFSFSLSLFPCEFEIIRTVRADMWILISGPLDNLAKFGSCRHRFLHVILRELLILN